MWTAEARVYHDRSGLRYSRGLTNEEWAVVEPLIPPGKPAGNQRPLDIGEVVNGLMYILGTGCQWRDIRRDLPAKSTIHDYFRRWDQEGTLARMPREFMRQAASWPAGQPHGGGDR